MQAVNPHLVSDFGSIQDAPSEISVHDSGPEDISDALSQASSFAGEEKHTSLAFGNSSIKKKRGPLSK